MTTYSKVYVGKGKKASNFSTKMTFKMNDIYPHIYVVDGVEYFSCEIAQMKEADKYSRTHTAWVSVKQVAVPETSNANEPEIEFPAETKKKRKQVVKK